MNYIEQHAFRIYLIVGGVLLLILPNLAWYFSEGRWDKEENTGMAILIAAFWPVLVPVAAVCGILLSLPTIFTIPARLIEHWKYNKKLNKSRKERS